MANVHVKCTGGLCITGNNVNYEPFLYSTLHTKFNNVDILLFSLHVCGDGETRPKCPASLVMFTRICNFSIKAAPISLRDQIFILL